MSKEMIYLYPLWVRLWHWINVVLCIFLILSGISLQYSNPEYPFIRFDIAVSMHNIAGILLTLSYVVFIIGNWKTENGKYYRMKIKKIIPEVKKQFVYYTVGIFNKNTPKPYPITKERKFNPLQKVSYISVMYIFFPVIFITGWALLFPETIFHNVFGFSGIHLTGLLHIIVGFFISVFMFVHIYFCTIGTTVKSNFTAMFTGWHK